MGAKKKSAGDAHCSAGRSWRLLRRAVAVGIVSVVLVQTGQLASAHTWYASVRSACAGSANKMRCYHELTRRRAGLHTLRPRHRLHRSARLKGDRIVACGELSHEPCGDSAFRAFYEGGYLPWPASWRGGGNPARGWATGWGAFLAPQHSQKPPGNNL